eukprot:scaffold17338_cov88-Skeletonema_dohrnii-CCMP3373.AAC.3
MSQPQRNTVIDVVATTMDAIEMETDADIAGDNAAGSINESFFSGFQSIMTTLGSFFLNKKSAAVFVAAILFSTGAIFGISMSVITGQYKQQQEDLAAITGHGRSHSHSKSGKSASVSVHSKSGKSVQSKSGKSASVSVCLSEHEPVDEGGLDFYKCEQKVVECGDIFTDEEIVLTHDVFCANNYWNATQEEKEELDRVNAAITLSGPSASIDCNGYSVRQIWTAPVSPPPKHARARDCIVSLLGAGSNDPFEPSPTRSYMRGFCSNYYQAGILLADGAKAINCKAEEFYDGFLIINGGELKKSEASGNTYGVAIQDVSGLRESIVSDVYTHDSFYGIEVRNVASSNAVILQEVTSRHNGGGMHLFGPNITVKDSTTSYNRMEGIFVGSGLYFWEPQGLYTTKVHFDGQVSSHNNYRHGIWFGSFGGWGDDPEYAEFTVKGDVSTYLNGDDGLSISSTPIHNITFTVEESGSLISCKNGGGGGGFFRRWGGPRHPVGVDIRNSMNEVSFIDEGTNGYTCDTTLEWGGGQGLPECVACQDACN